jgi:two-component system sensor histidine kinase VicK
MPEDIPDIYDSSSRIRQVLQNLINNAISYTNEGVVTFAIERKDGEMQVDVVDTCIGIPRDELPRIFDDFFRASNVEIKGTGLDFSIAKRIVEAHGGKIWVEISNSGNKFSFTLSIDKKGAQT